MEIITGDKPDVIHLRLFGCEVWMHVPLRKKLDNKGRQGIMLNFLLHVIYWIWEIDPTTVVEARHVILNETFSLSKVIGAKFEVGDDEEVPTKVLWSDNEIGYSREGGTVVQEEAQGAKNVSD